MTEQYTWKPTVLFSPLRVWLGLAVASWGIFLLLHGQVWHQGYSAVSSMGQSSQEGFQPPTVVKVLSRNVASHNSSALNRPAGHKNNILRQEILMTQNGSQNLDTTRNQAFIVKNFSATEFERQDGVVIVTKIHGPDYVPMLEQSLCLLHQAYNRHLLYDIVVFTTEPIPEDLLVTLYQTLHPVHLTIVRDNDGLQAEIAKLSPERRNNFLEACQVSNPENLTWWSKCPDRLAYNWQAEFRSWHIWNHPALMSYRWMMWLDADAFCSRVWKQDPVAIAVQNNLTIFFANFPQGFAAGSEIHSRIRQSFQTSLCHLNITKSGHLARRTGAECGDNPGKGISLIHGFFHITNLDFYRSEIVQQWSKILIGNGFLQRKFDDQVAVTVPAAILTPQQSWMMRSVGVPLYVYHNGKLDGNLKAGGFKRRWNKKGGKDEFPEAVGKCVIVAGG